MVSESYLTGDDMIALLIGEGGDEGATFAPEDMSLGALIARNGEVFSEIRNPGRGSLIDFYAFHGGDGLALAQLGYVFVPHYTSVTYYALTDKGAALARALCA